MTIALYQRPAFKRVYKKLHANQRDAVHDAMRALITNPLLGEEKKGDLAGVRVHKFDSSISSIYLPTCGTRVHVPGWPSAPTRTSTAT